METPAAAAAAILFLVCVLIGLLQGEPPFYFDSGNYWAISKTFTADGHFSLFNFEYTGLRGYCIPLLYFLWSNGTDWIAASASLQVVLLNAALFALIGAVLIPRLAEIAWNEPGWGLGRRLVAGGLLLVFWRGFLNFPLSDFPALAAALTAIVAVERGGHRSLLLAGVAAAFASNARPAYLLLAPLLLGIVIWNQADRSDIRKALQPRRLGRPAIFLVGLALVTIPQSAIQHHFLGGYSPIPGGSELAQLQYTAGLEMDLYGVYVGPGAAALEYRDPDTTPILEELPGGKVSGTTEYAELILRHPLTMTRLFGRHLVDGLDFRYSTPYSDQLRPSSFYPLRAAGFLLVFLALLRFGWPEARRSLGQARWRYPAVLLVLGLAALPTAMEPRFLLPIFVLGVMLVLAPGWPSPIQRGLVGWTRFRRPLSIGFAAAVFSAVVAITVHSASDHLVLQPVEVPLADVSSPIAAGP